MRASFLAGGAMGAITAAFLRRPIVPGILTIAGLCTGVQFMSNESVLAVKNMASTGKEPAPPVEASPDRSPAPEAVPKSEPAPTDPAPTKSRGWLMGLLEKNDIIVPLSDAEYKERLLQRRSEIDREIILLEQELAQERKQLHELQTSGP